MSDIAGVKHTHTAIITFNTQTTALIDQTFDTPIRIVSIELTSTRKSDITAICTGDKTTIELSEKAFEHYGEFIEYFDMNTKSLKITPSFGAARVGSLIILYEGARKIKSNTIGTSAPLY